MIHEVYKKISMSRDPVTQKDIYMLPGTLVETGEWRNERSLIAQGYLGPPRKSQTEINKFLAKNAGKTVATTNPVGVKRPPLEEKQLEEVPITI